jgi:hypothetical protein
MQTPVPGYISLTTFTIRFFRAIIGSPDIRGATYLADCSGCFTRWSKIEVFSNTGALLYKSIHIKFYSLLGFSQISIVEVDVEQVNKPG